MSHARGSFEVKLTPPASADAGDTALARMLIDKKISGDLDATSQGQMLSTMNNDKGSGGYVAMERITGRLQGRDGSFILQHTATMTRSVPQLSITVVPDSGTGQLAGIGGAMTIKIDQGNHSYDFEYTLPEAP